MPRSALSGSRRNYPTTSGACSTQELERRYFAPRILSIESLVEKFAESHWQVVTDAGPCRFRVQSDHTQIRELTGGTLLINDVDGNRYLLENRQRLPARILKQIEEQI